MHPTSLRQPNCYQKWQEQKLSLKASRLLQAGASACYLIMLVRVIRRFLVHYSRRMNVCDCREPKRIVTEKFLNRAICWFSSLDNPLFTENRFCFSKIRFLEIVAKCLAPAVSLDVIAKQGQTNTPKKEQNLYPISTTSSLNLIAIKEYAAAGAAIGFVVMGHAPVFVAVSVVMLLLYFGGRKPHRIFYCRNGLLFGRLERVASRYNRLLWSSFFRFWIWVFSAFLISVGWVIFWSNARKKKILTFVISLVVIIVPPIGLVG